MSNSTTTVTKECAKFATTLQAKNYSPKTVNCYVSILRGFLREFRKSPLRISAEEITRFIANHSAAATKAQIRGALSNYYTHVVGQPKKFQRIPQPKKEKKLPRIFSSQVIVQRLAAIPNIKHQAMMSILYGAGLRLSELTHLKITDIDKFRQVIHIRSGKGAKDRVVPISSNLLQLLRNYYKAYRPTTHLFQGQTGHIYSPTSVQAVSRKYMKCNPHTLRHCHATHLIEAGVDVSEVSKRLGHSKIETTMIYNHVATTNNPITLLAA